MQKIDPVRQKIGLYARRQRFADFLAHLVFAIGTALIAFTVALCLLKSPWYGLIGIFPLFFFRPRSFISRARELDRKISANGELVNGIQISEIQEGSKEQYSKNLIGAFIAEVAEKFARVDTRKYISYKLLRRSSLFLLVSIAACLFYPALFPGHFWFSITRDLAYIATPPSGSFPRGAEVELKLSLFGSFLPGRVNLIYETRNNIYREPLCVANDMAARKVTIESALTYHYEFLGQRTENRRLSVIEPLLIQSLEFHLRYPAYTKLKDDVKITRQLVAPVGTRVLIKGRASQTLSSSELILEDTLTLKTTGSEFSGEFTVRKSGTASLRLFSGSEAKESISIYAIPDLAPLVDVFYPGYNINMPYDMKISIGIKCSDDYGLQSATFCYEFEDKKTLDLGLKSGLVEDTIFHNWDLSSLGMLPGEEVAYYVLVKDNAGNLAKSKTYRVVFPTMEQIYDEVSGKEELVQTDLKELQKMHSEETKEVERIEEKIMKERQLSWLDKEKLKEAIGQEEKVIEKIKEWQEELERTIEKMNEGIILDQKSLERLQEIARILEEIAPEQLKKALENMEMQLDKKPGDLKKALENLKAAQEELTRALERTLEILKRYQQEEKLRELAENAKELARQAEKINETPESNQTADAAKDSLYRMIDSLAQEIRKLAQSKDLEPQTSSALQDLAQQTENISEDPAQQMSKTETDLNKLSADLQKLYEELTRGRSAMLRKNLLETLNRLIDISKSEEEIFKKDRIDTDRQEHVINATKAVAESLYSQQTKSMYVSPQTSKKLAKALKEMEQAFLNNAEPQGRTSAQEAMKQLNLACLDILESLKKANEGSGSSTGMDQFLQNLSGISQGQMSINESMMSLFPLPMSGMSSEQMAQLQRLAGRQRELREALEALKDQPGAGKYQDLLNELGNEMKDIEDALYQYKLDRKLIERQQMIISRLLDAQKSVRQEDYSRERKSKPGEDAARETPAPLPGELGMDELREIIQQALKEPYPEEYEVYIREYFKALLEKQDR